MEPDEAKKAQFALNERREHGEWTKPNGMSMVGDTIHVSNEAVRVPVAICGMAMRLPGGIRTEEKMWNLLINQQDARGTVPLSRYDSKGFNGMIRKRPW
jgi:hypothetical protein